MRFSIFSNNTGTFPKRRHEGEGGREQGSPRVMNAIEFSRRMIVGKRNLHKLTPAKGVSNGNTGCDTDAQPCPDILDDCFSAAHGQHDIEQAPVDTKGIKPVEEGATRP